MDRCLFILLVSLIDVGLISPKLFLKYFDFIYSFTFDGTCIVGYSGMESEGKNNYNLILVA